MNIDRAREIVSTLAEGIDPITGEVLAADHVCNKGEVVRAFYALLDTHAPKKAVKKSKPKEPEDYDKDLYERLRTLRNKMATQKGLQAFQVVTNLALMHMAAQKPTTNEEFLEIHGVGKYTATQYGPRFLAEIKEYLERTT